MIGKRILVLSIALLLALAACNLPQAGAGNPQSASPTDTPWPTTPPLPTPSPTTTYSGLIVHFTNLADGSRLAGALDPQGVPVNPVGADLGGTILPGKPWPENLVLYIDGVGDSRPFPVTKGQLPLHVDFRLWLTPGKHTLQVHAYNPHHAEVDQALGYPLSDVITITVTAMPAPPITQRIIQLYQEKFNLKLTAPAISRDDSTDPSKSEWISLAYIGDTLYEIFLHDDGTVIAKTVSLNNPSDGSLCRPAGDYRMLVVFVDYGNLGITREDAFAALKQAQDKQNGLNAQYSKDLGLTTPILQVETTAAFISLPPQPGKMLTRDEIKSRTGFDPKDFDLTAEVDLDQANTFGTAAGDVGQALGGCKQGAGTDPIDIWIVSQAGASLYYDLNYTLLDHELFHDMGWAHYYPCRQNIFDDYNGDYGNSATFDVCDFAHAPLLFGWEDLNGNGIPEILDPAPYGLIR